MSTINPDRMLASLVLAAQTDDNDASRECGVLIDILRLLTDATPSELVDNIRNSVGAAYINFDFEDADNA